MKAINFQFSFRGALNAEHYQIHGDLLEAISREHALNLYLSDLRDRYEALYKEENGCFFLSRANVWTRTVQESHALHLQQFNYILKRMDSERCASDATMKAAAEALLLRVGHFQAVKRMRYAAASGGLKDFIDRLREADCVPHVEMLQLTEAIDQLETLNKSFITVYNSRSAQYLDRATSHTMRTIRPLVDSAFKELAGAINSLYQVNELTEKSEEKEQQLGKIIDDMNALLYQLQMTLSRVKAGAKPTPGEESKPTTPSEPDSSEEPEPDIPEIV